MNAAMKRKYGLAMLAVDTNVIVRLLVKDNLEQHQLAVRLFDVESVYLAKTALLEAEWVCGLPTS